MKKKKNEWMKILFVLAGIIIKYINFNWLIDVQVGCVYYYNKNQDVDCYNVCPLKLTRHSVGRERIHAHWLTHWPMGGPPMSGFLSSGPLTKENRSSLYITYARSPWRHPIKISFNNIPQLYHSVADLTIQPFTIIKKKYIYTSLIFIFVHKNSLIWTFCG